MNLTYPGLEPFTLEDELAQARLATSPARWRSIRVILLPHDSPDSDLGKGGNGELRSSDHVPTAIRNAGGLVRWLPNISSW